MNADDIIERDDRLHGGEIWTQKRGSCFSCYTVFIELDVWVIIQPPDQRGNMAWKNDPEFPGKVFYTNAELLHRFDSMGYECEGQFSDILKAEAERVWEAAQSAKARVIADELGVTAEAIDGLEDIANGQPGMGALHKAIEALSVLLAIGETP